MFFEKTENTNNQNKVKEKIATVVFFIEDETGNLSQITNFLNIFTTKSLILAQDER